LNEEEEEDILKQPDIALNDDDELQKEDAHDFDRQEEELV
jgi:hypothetical protein